MSVETIVQDRIVAFARAPVTPSCLHHFFETQAELNPNRIAVEAGGRTLTYGELNRRAHQIAWSLRERGAGPGSLVGLFHRKSCELFAGMLGILKAGAGYVPVDPTCPANRIRHIFDDANVCAIVTESHLAANLEPSRAAHLLLDRDAAEIGSCPPSSPPSMLGANRDRDLCYVIYTSGSTGRPKGVMIEHRNAVTFVKTLASIYKISPDDRIYQGFSTAFDASVEEIWAAFAIGGTLCVAPDDVARSPADVAEFITANRISYFSTVPTFLSMMEADLPTVRLLVVGGEACSSDLVHRWAKPARRMLNTYGPTEATVVATYAECIAGQPVTIGRALPGYTTYVLDEHQRPVKPGEAGELVIGGAGVARGYINRPDLTAEKFIANPFSDRIPELPMLYRTHDLVCAGADGALSFLGRIDDQIKIRGYRVELSEIEAVMLEHPSVQAAAVRAVQSGGLPELAAYVVLSGTEELDRLSLATVLGSRLPDYMMPRFLDVVPELPLMISGKVDRKQLPEPVSLLRRSLRNVEAPANDLERKICDIWQNRFAGIDVSVVDDFFLDLGGHSLLAAQVVTELRTKLGLVSASVRDLYRCRSIRAFATHLAEANKAQAPLAETAPGGDTRTASRASFDSVSPAERWTTVVLQMFAILVYEAIQITPIALLAILTMQVLDKTLDVESAFGFATIIGFAMWPSMLLISIAAKWLVVGRLKPGAYPVWGLYYCRWWIANLFQNLSWSHMFSGTPVMSLYHRAMGARVGKGVTISTSICSAYDLLSVGDNSSIGAETHMTGYRVEDGLLKLGRIDIGADCFVGMHCALGLNVSMAAGACLDDLSQLNDGQAIPAGAAYQGAPSAPAAIVVPQREGASMKSRPILFGAIHILLIYVMGYFLILTGLPAAILVGYALISADPYLAIAAVVVSVPVSVVWYAVCLVAIKKLFIGKIEAGRYPLHSVRYLRLWFFRYLLANTRQILMPVYATIYLPALYRLLGAKIGARTELSTVNETIPDLLDVGEGGFLADECMIGGVRVHNGVAEAKPVKIGKRVFVGNSALVRGGSTVGDQSLIGVMSAPPTDMAAVPEHSQWLGSPGFALPRREAETRFDAAQTFEPSRASLRQRAVIDAFRILLPGYLTLAALAVVLLFVVAAYRLLPLWSLVLALPFAVVLISAGSVFAVAAVKRFVIGTYEPGVHPLWSPFVWLNDVINGVFESVAAIAMSPFMGTPLIAPLLRAMGCHIGKWTFIDTTLFSEFDLVHIGDHAALNLGSTLQTHLFEDRVMKSEVLKIGDGCSVGNMSIVLYGTEMQSGSVLGPLSLLMKGETLPAKSRWRGIPSEPVAKPAPVRLKNDVPSNDVGDVLESHIKLTAAE